MITNFITMYWPSVQDDWKTSTATTVAALTTAFSHSLVSRYDVRGEGEGGNRLKMLLVMLNKDESSLPVEKTLI